MIPHMKPIPAILQKMLLIGLLGLGPPAAVQALPVDELYVGEIAVEGQGEQERRRAYREAMRRVVVKVSGDPAHLEEPAIETAISSAADYVEEVSYRSRRVPVQLPEGDQRDGSSPAAGQLQAYMRVTFAEDLVNGVLRSADVSIWGRNRPSVLVWLTVQQDDGQRRILGSDSSHPALEVIREFSRRRAIPLLIPLMDLSDRRALSVDEAWALEEQAIREASARYGADSVLAGRMLETGDGEIAGLWQFQFRDETERFDSLAEGLEAYLEQPLDRATVALARHYALESDSSVGERQVTLSVEAVDGVGAYSGLLQYLEEIDLVQSVAVSRLNGENLELTLTVNGSAQRLAEFIALDRDLQPTGENGTDGDDAALQYRWTR